MCEGAGGGGRQGIAAIRAFWHSGSSVMQGQMGQARCVKEGDRELHSGDKQVNRSLPSFCLKAHDPTPCHRLRTDSLGGRAPMQIRNYAPAYTYR